MMAGLSRAVSSPYLLNVSLYMLLFTITATILYFQQADIAAKSFTDRAARTAFFARIDLVVNALTLVTQLFLTSRILKALGVALTLSLLPLLSVVGFAWLGATPTIAAIVVLQVARRAGNFAIARPTREVLFTVLGREDKYKAKSFIDTVVYRLGDQVGAWSYAALGWFGLTLLGHRLGRRAGVGRVAAQRVLARQASGTRLASQVTAVPAGSKRPSTTGRRPVVPTRP